ncbi:protein TsetseEP-like [Panicum virgatum]|uniref:DUF4408 domain-containing protein n=1 Tax=Panicum virgatum TaxID=38727 RepID=A0A8T0TWT0_PANVG|nr:protein TsetseEP-like [Panicum virgatum]KAG2612379.1 hypothetical protein PVAP13_4KG277305 [Panicum virgatum]
MLEEAIPALWSAVHGFFTPAVLFVVLNIVIGTIAVTSKVAAPAAADAAEEEEGAAAAPGAGGEQYRKLSRVPSMAFGRLRSFNLSRFAAPAPEPAVAGAVDLGYEQPPALAAEQEEPVVVQRVVEPEPEPEPELEPEPEPEPEREHEDADAHTAAHVERSRSEAAAQAELPRLPARLRKSASDRSAFAHFEAEEVEEAVRAVEARRPATTREGARARRAPAAEPEPEPEPEEEAGAGGEVDALADAFINKFHHQLKLQRIESFIRHRETVRRGQAAGGVVV